jgi:hypothetical protein
MLFSPHTSSIVEEYEVLNMKLADYLLYRDIQDLSLMASYYECDCNRNSKLELVQTIHHNMLNKKILEEHLNQLESPLIHFYTYILFQQTRSFSIDELVAKGKYICQLFNYDVSLPRKWIADCLKRGWLFPTSSKYQVQLEIPVDFLPYLRKQWIYYWSSKYQMTICKDIDQRLRDEGTSLLADLSTFLAFVKEKSLPITLDGVIHKRYQQMILSKFNITEEVVQVKSWRFGYGRRFPNYPNRLALIYDFCYFKQWIQEDQEMLFITKKGEDVLRTENMVSGALHEDVVSFWKKTYKNAVPCLPFLFQFILEISAEQWIESNQLYRMIQPWLQPYYYDDEETIYRERIVQMLVHLGLMQVSRSKEEESTYLRFTPLKSMRTSYC